MVKYVGTGGYKHKWNWRDDIYDCDYDDGYEDLYAEIAENILHKDKSGKYQCWEDIAETIYWVYKIPKSTNLYRTLQIWYREIGKSMQDSIHDYYETNDAIYFTSSGRYSTMDEDLFGGDGSGVAEAQFNFFLRSGYRIN